MKIASCLLVAATLLSGCISSGDPNPPAKTTVVVPANTKTTVVVPANTTTTTTVVCQDGSRPPC
jgi:PBP1b-binding outer membrane lipoprotein LpoB